MFIHSWVATSIVVLLSALIQGTTGFGFALIAVPPLTLIYDPHSAIEMGMLLSTTSMIWMWFQSRKEERVSITWRLYLAAIIGLPLGLWVLNNLNTAPMRIFVGVVTIGLAGCLSVVITKGTALPSATNFPAAGSWPRVITATGFVSGFLMGSLGMAGPPVVALISGTGLPKSIMRATMVEFFALIYVTAVIAALLSGTIPRPLVIRSLGYLPALAIGIAAGNFVHKASSQRLYMMATLVLIAMAGASCLWSGFGSLVR